MVEEIDIQRGLDNTRDNGDEVSVVVGLRLCTVDPVGDVQCPV